MPRITYLKEINGELWARLELDQAPADGAAHIFTTKEIEELKTKERQKVWAEIEEACHVG